MDDCPHCGEPLEDDAVSCPHCGSDFETGWKPDSDYYGLELPDDEPGAPPEAFERHPKPLWQSLTLFVVLGVSMGALVGAHVYVGSRQVTLLVFFLVLGASFILFQAGTTRSGRQR